MAGYVKIAKAVLEMEAAEKSLKTATAEQIAKDPSRAGEFGWRKENWWR